MRTPSFALAVVVTSFISLDARSDANCGGLSGDYSVRAASADWTIPAADCSSTAPLTPPQQPMVVTHQKLMATGGGPLRSPSPRHPAGGDPVLGNGEFFEQRTDASLAGLGPHYELERTYRSRVNFKSSLGYGWDHSYDKRILGQLTLSPTEHIAAGCDQTIDYQDGELNIIQFTRDPATSQYRAPGVPLVLTQTTDANGYSVWQIVDEKGNTLTFDIVGYLSTLTDLAGNTLHFSWEYTPASVSYPDDKLHGRAKRLTFVDDGARTVHYIYNSDSTLQCVSLGATCGTPTARAKGVLAYFTYSPKGDLAEVYHGSGSSVAAERYAYRDATVPANWFVPYLPLDCLPNSVISGYCHRLCDSVDETNSATELATCRNLDYAVPITTYCENWSCAHDGPQGSVKCVEVPRQAQPDQLCMAEYDMAPDCNTGCAARYQCKNNVDLRASYSFGNFDDLLHNLVDIYDERGVRLVHNEYGENPWDISFDRVTAQHLGPDGDEPNTIKFAYHDLELEAGTSPVRTDPGSTPDPLHVVPLASYYESYECPHMPVCLTGPDRQCSVATYGPPASSSGVGPPTMLPPAPKNAVVVTDVHGATHTQYFDEKWNLIREVNDSDQETTDFNYDLNGYLKAVAEPSGIRTCFEHDIFGHLKQSTRLPAPGYPGATTPMVTAYRYDSASQLVDQWHDVMGVLAKTHYERDGRERVSTIDRDVVAGQPPQRTTLSYDEDPPPVGVRETPATVRLPDGTVNTYRDLDPSMGGPRDIVLDSGGALPEHRYVAYDERGRVLEAGEVGRFARQWVYDDGNKLIAIGHRPDTGSPWVQTTIASHEAGGMKVDSTVEPQRHTTFEYLGQYANAVWYVPASSAYGEQTELSCAHYAADGRLEGAILPAGNEVEYDYDPTGRPTAVWQGFPTGTPPASAWRKSCSGRIGPLGDPGKQMMSSWTYGAGGFLTAFSDKGVDRKILTDGFGRIIQTDTGHPSLVDIASTQTGYDSAGRVAWRAQFIAGEALPNYPYQKPTMTTPALLTMMEIDHDVLGRVTAQRRWLIETGEVLTTTWAYDDAHRVVTVTDRGVTTTRTYDGRGRIVAGTFADGSTVQISHFTDYDVVVRQTNQDTPLTRTIRFDTRGNPTRILDENGRILYSASYDDAGNRISEQVTGAGTTTRTFDVYDRLYLERKDLLNGQVSDHYFSWDVNNRLAAVRDAFWHTWTIAYTGFDRPLTIQDPLGRVDRYSYVGGFTVPAGRVDSTGRHSCFRYDFDLRPAYVYDTDCADNQDLRIVATPLVERRSWAYTETGERAAVRAPANGASAASDVEYTYDSLGRETSETVKNGGPIDAYVISSSYGDQGRTVDTQIWAGLSPTYTPTNFSMLSWSAATPLARSGRVICPVWGCGPPPPPPPPPPVWIASFEHHYDTSDRLAFVNLNDTRMATWDYGVGAGGPLSLAYANGATTKYTYDDRLRQTRMDVLFQPAGAANAAPIASLADVFGADSIPRMRQRTFGSQPPLTDVYQIDGDGRVTAESTQIVAVTLPSGEIDDTTISSYLGLGNWRYYAIDGNGDWTSVASSGSGGAVDHTVDAATRLTAVGGKTMTIDAHDNLQGIAGGALGFTFDPFSGDVLTASNGAAQEMYTYDALDRRVTEVSGNGKTGVFLWHGAQLMAHGDPANLTIDVPGDDVDDHIASVEANGTGTARFYHQGQDGSVLAVSDASGLVEGYAYTAFGEATLFAPNGAKVAGSTFDNRFGFQGQLFDPSSGTYSMRARHYVPAWGRFVSPDPLSIAAAPSLYSFTGSRPLAYRDPSGLAMDSGRQPRGPCDNQLVCVPTEPKSGGGDGGTGRGGGNNGDDPGPGPSPDPGPGPGGDGSGGGGGGDDGGGGGVVAGLPPFGGHGTIGGGGGGRPPSGREGPGRENGRGGSPFDYPPGRVFAGPVSAGVFPQVAQAMQLADELAQWCTETNCLAKLQELAELLPGVLPIVDRMNEEKYHPLSPKDPPSAAPLMAEKAPGRPTAADGYKAPKGYNGQKVRSPNGGGYGWLDDKGRVWVPTGEGPGTAAHGGPHWDVQSPGGGYVNIFPGGRQR